MYKRDKIRILFAILLLIGLAGIHSCANRGLGPQGGPKDETPPEVVKEMPANGSLNFHGKQIEILFNEYIQLDKVADNVMMSPPQQRPPEVKALGKKVTVTFDEDLTDSTTYTIDFGSAICDNNEKNPIEGYSFSFSTGDVIDSLEISGQLLNAEDLNPVSGILVGIHKNPDDSALAKIPFTRIGKTDADGFFTIRNIHPGSYRVYALGDVSKDYVYQPGEGLALYDTLVSPECHSEILPDTLWKDSVTIDTIKQVTTKVCDHDNIILMYFKENKQRRYFQRVMREEAHFFTLFFASPQDSLPLLRLLDTEEILKLEAERQAQEMQSQSGKKKKDKKSKRSKKSALVDSVEIASIDTVALDTIANDKVVSDTVLVDSVMTDSAKVQTTVFRPNFENYGISDFTFCQVNPTKDTITYWLTDSSYIRRDTLIFEVLYQKTDSLYELQWVTDTIRALYRAPRISEKMRERMEKTKPKPRVEIRSNGKSPFEIYASLEVNMSTPVRTVVGDSIHLYEMVDTVPKLIKNIQMLPVDSSYMRWQISHDWKPDTSYRLLIDSAAVTDIYGVSNDKFKAEFKSRTLDEYSTMIIKIEPFDSRGMIQIMDDKDKPVRTEHALAEGTKFEYLTPKSYYVRMYLDLNGDSVWTTGDYQTHRHPEPVYYFPSKLTLRANWDFEETFKYLEQPIEEQKPSEISKDASSKKK